ncbi:MAG: YrzQ family protein [Bacillus sp. (in: firmicutes)]
MGKTVNTLLIFGAGMAAFNYLQKNNMMSSKQMKKIQKRVMKAI